MYVCFFLKGDTQRHGFAENKTPLAPPSRDSVTSNIDTDKRENVDYFSKKKFWQSFESASSDTKLPGPIPKPRASICTSSLKGDVPPMVSRRSAENVIDQPANARKEQRVNKSESEDNVVFVATSHNAETRTRPSMKQMHSVTAFSTDSEAEYIASCGIDKLAFENVAFCEEEEDLPAKGETIDAAGNVKAKKMFFEQHIQNERQSFEEGVASKEFIGVTAADANSPLRSAEEHIDKSELEGTEKRKECLSDDTEDISAVTPIDVHTDGSNEGVDSTRSESDIIPEELQDKHSSFPDSESNHVDGGSESKTRVAGQIETERVKSTRIETSEPAASEISESIETDSFKVTSEGERSAETKLPEAGDFKKKQPWKEEITITSEEQRSTHSAEESSFIETKTSGETRFKDGETVYEKKSEITKKSSSSGTKSEQFTSSTKKESKIPVRVPSENKCTEKTVEERKTNIEEKKSSSTASTTIISIDRDAEKVENKEESGTLSSSKKTEVLRKEEVKIQSSTVAQSEDIPSGTVKKSEVFEEKSMKSDIVPEQYEPLKMKDYGIKLVECSVKPKKSEETVTNTQDLNINQRKAPAVQVSIEKLDHKLTENVTSEFPKSTTEFTKKCEAIPCTISSQHGEVIAEKAMSADSVAKKLDDDNNVVKDTKGPITSDHKSGIAIHGTESKKTVTSAGKLDLTSQNVPELKKSDSDTDSKTGVTVEDIKLNAICTKVDDTKVVSEVTPQKSGSVNSEKEKVAEDVAELTMQTVTSNFQVVPAIDQLALTKSEIVSETAAEIPVSKTLSSEENIQLEPKRMHSRITSQCSSSDQSESGISSTVESHSTVVKPSFGKGSLKEELPDYIHQSSLLGSESSHETDISDEQMVAYEDTEKEVSDFTKQRISESSHQSNLDFNHQQSFVGDDEVKLAATNLIDEIETEINRRPDILENLVLAGHIEYLPSESNDDITDEDLRSTGTEVDIVIPDNDYFRKSEAEDDSAFVSPKMKLSEASPTECEINYEQAEEFNVLESVDFEEQVIPEEPECLDVQDECKGSFAMENRMEQTHSKPPIPEHKKQSAEMRRKSSEESNARTDIVSPESGSSDPSRKFEEVTARVPKNKRSTAEHDPCSSSSESHYQSFASDNRTSSRPCSSDVEGLLSSAVPGTTGSSEYDTAVSHDTSNYSHDFHTAVSSASLHESLKSIDSESSGHLGSAEGSSEISETLVPSSAELEHDIDVIAPNLSYEENRRGIHQRMFLEPYDTDIPLNVIKGAAQSPADAEIERPSKDRTEKAETVTKLLQQDDKLMSSCEDTSSLSITEPNVQTVVEMPSTDSDRMDTSLTSEQSLTMSAISNHPASSPCEFKEDLEVDRKTVDTNTIPTLSVVHEGGSVTLITSTGEDQGRNYVCTQVTSKIESKHTTEVEKPASTVDAALQNISPESESFELIEKPDLLDDFVIIEEVAKEASEQDCEGKAIRITEKRKSGTFMEEDVPPKIETTLTKVKYYGGATEEGCTFEGVTFEQEKPNEFENSPPPDYELNEHEVEEGKKWIEMQFQTDSEVATAYEYTYERVPLEDIKEEDTDDMQSSKVGSVSSQISQSIGSLGSMKQSLSSTPDYDILAGKRCFSKSAEPDTVSQASLQEFERLEQLMALESMKSKLSGSQDSLGSSSPGEKKRGGDDISLSSLKEFEGLEFACREAEKVEERAKAEERSLSQIEEGHESQASESESCETLEKSCYESDENDEDYDKKMFEIDEIIRQAQSNVEKFVDRLERTESLGRGDSFEEAARIPDLDFDQPTDATHSSSEVYSGKRFIDNVDLSHSLTVSTDSLETKQAKLHDDLMITSSDSLEGSASKSKHKAASDSLENTENRPDSPKSDDEFRCFGINERNERIDLLHDDADINTQSRISPNQISSPDSMDATSSAATHATYQNEMDSTMSSSFTSGGSNTMVSSNENLDNIVTSYSNWLEGSQQHTYVSSMTEVVETVLEDRHCVTTHRTVEIPAENIQITYTGPDARRILEKDVASFGPGELVSETREVDVDGNIRVKRVMETRTVLASDQIEETQKFVLDPKTFVDERQIKTQSGHDPTILSADTGRFYKKKKKKKVIREVMCTLLAILQTPSLQLHILHLEYNFS